jgi:hypothetical protein
VQRLGCLVWVTIDPQGAAESIFVRSVAAGSENALYKLLTDLKKILKEFKTVKRPYTSGSVSASGCACSLAGFMIASMPVVMFDGRPLTLSVSICAGKLSLEGAATAGTLFAGEHNARICSTLRGILARILW